MGSRATRTLADQLHARRAASHRLPPQPCGCRDPYLCRCTGPLVSECQLLDGAHAAALHLLAHGVTPLFDTDTLDALWYRDPQLAQHLFTLAGGE